MWRGRWMCIIGAELGTYLYEAFILSIEYRNLYNTSIQGTKIWMSGLSFFGTAHQKAPDISKSRHPPISITTSPHAPPHPLKSISTPTQTHARSPLAYFNSRPQSPYYPTPHQLPRNHYLIHKTLIIKRSKSSSQYYQE